MTASTAAPEYHSFYLGGHMFCTGTSVDLCASLEHWLLDRDNVKPGQKRNHLVGFINPHVFNELWIHESVSLFLQKAEVVCVDGVGVKLALLLFNGQSVPRVVAEHLFRRFLTHYRHKASAVLIGAGASEVAVAADAINAYSTGIEIIDTIDGFKSIAAYRQFFKSHADVPLVLIGAGSPKSETIALVANELCSESVIFHIGGGTIKTWAGTKRCGPALVSRLGLEWLHRMIFEPHTRVRYTRGGWLYLKNLLQKKKISHIVNEGEIR